MLKQQTLRTYYHVAMLIYVLLLFIMAYQQRLTPNTFVLLMLLQLASDIAFYRWLKTVR